MAGLLKRSAANHRQSGASAVDADSGITVESQHAIGNIDSGRAPVNSEFGLAAGGNRPETGTGERARATLIADVQSAAKKR